MQVLPHDYQTGRTTHRHGFARTASLIRKARGEAANTLLLDNGDFLCGNGSEIMPQTLWKHAHPMIEIMNHLGYDAATPGNHDFDQGLGFFRKVVEQAGFPFVCANAHLADPAPGQETALLPPYLILERELRDQADQAQLLRIGITGFMPPNSVTQGTGQHPPIRVSDIVDCAARVVPQMKAAGADLIVALAHSGIGDTEHLENMENATVPLAALEGIDVVVSGHRHQVFPGPDWPPDPIIDPKRGTVHGKPVVSAGFWGSHLGMIDLELEHGRAGWKIRRHRVEARAVYECRSAGSIAPAVETDREVHRIMAPAHRHIVKWLEKPLGETAVPLHSYFALAAPSLAVQVIQKAQIWALRRTWRHQEAQALPILSSACAFKAGGYGGPDYFTAVPAGRVTRSAIADLYPFPNKLVLLRLTGAQLRDWLERAASLFNQARPAPGETPPALKPGTLPGYLYETVLGVEYQIDLAAPARFDPAGRRISDDNGRVRGLRHAGKPVADDDRFLLITNSYRLGGGGNYPFPAQAQMCDLPTLPTQQVLAAYFRAHPVLEPVLEPHWRFAPVPGARLRFRSSPAALAHLGEVTDATITPAGRDDAGYQLFDLRL